MSTPQQAQEFITKLQGKNIVLLLEGSLYLIPFEKLRQFLMPDEFQKDQVGLDTNFFHFTRGPSDSSPPNEVRPFVGVVKALSGLLALEKIDSAVMLTAAEMIDGGTKVSKAAQSGFVFTKYSTDNKIEVDLTKGGRPSNA